MSKYNGAASVQVRLIRSEEDIEATWPLYLALLRESRYGSLSPNKEQWTNYLQENVLGKPDRFGFIIAEWQEKPVGFLGCTANRFLYCEEIISSCMSFYVLSVYRKTLLGGRIAVKLLDAYRCWATNRRAVEIQFHVTSGIGIVGTDSFLRRAGFRQVGGNYSMALPIQTDKDKQ
ncbi:N-acetyltransferase family protein [Candidatus Spongiihabitans sp.]|uniref:GNAT family N-acetyltransferase n=1 Tax=Candidatus Spongiihabitans sp. TaxID=3101308 RepID=UPI003C7B1DA4